MAHPIRTDSALEEESTCFKQIFLSYHYILISSVLPINPSLIPVRQRKGGGVESVSSSVL